MAKFFTTYGGFQMAVDDIQEWQRETFPGVAPKDALGRMLQEADELEEVMDELPNVPVSEVMDELADVFIVMCQVAAALDGDLSDAVTRKMNINLSREWKINPDGTGQHK